MNPTCVCSNLCEFIQLYMEFHKVVDMVVKVPIEDFTDVTLAIVDTFWK